MADDEDPNDDDNGQNPNQQQQHSIDIWIESQNLLKNSEILQHEHVYLNGYSTLVFVGSQFGGKSSIINRFIDPTTKSLSLDKYDETIGLEYRYLCRRIDSLFDDRQRSKQQQQQQMNETISLENNEKICNIWELGYELLFIDLLKFAINLETIQNITLIIVIDLTQPNKMSILLEQIIKWIRKYLQSLLATNDDQFEQQLRQLALKRSIYYRNDQDQDNQDDRPKNPLLIPVTIIGSKYDEYQNMDPEIKKQITRYLRLVSYELGGQLLYHSCRSETLTKRINQAFESLAFDRLTFDLNERSKPSISTNIAKPVLLPFGYDTLAKIGVESKSSESVMDQAKKQFEQIFPQKILEQSYQSTIDDDIDPRFDPNFAEPEIDKILEYKYMLLDK
uniref:Cytoplasmic dynein 2 light intermediate chain 1 n=1 Tax=Dermatophagoides pteronyssinus TaxID=6956 RepID=A0A6P6Y623_DERPT|nr:cytoplasmic dynein 2 light intermediate chain 1-like isoform X1 [Dermatophagoides pteronyssinus]